MQNVKIELSDYFIFQNMYVLDILKCDVIT